MKAGLVRHLGFACGVLFAGTAALAAGRAVVQARAVPTGGVPTDVQMPGTQPDDPVFDLHTPNDCANCHGGYNPQTEPTHQWRGSMMSHASRDPLFWATLAVVEQDFAGGGDFWIRCHVPSGWLAGRSVPTDGAALDPVRDVHGVECDQCHRLTNPDESELVGVQNPPFVANSGGGTPEGYYGSGQYVIWNGTAPLYETSKLGPYANAGAPHGFVQSRYHRQSEMCGTCHDVSNPFTGDLAPGNGAQLPLAPGTFSGVAGSPVEGKAAFNNSPYQYGVVERTFSELKASLLDTLPVSQLGTLPAELQQGALKYARDQALAAGQGGNYEDGTVRTFSCQSCHMAPTTGQGCSFGGPTRADLPRHDLTGGNYWMPDAIQWLDQQGLLILGGGLTPAQVTAMNDGKQRARESLSRAAGLSVTGNTLRIVNLTGHKLITGYPEGRRMWVNTKWYGSNGALLREDGAYGPITATVQGLPTPVDTLLDLSGANTRIYESQGGISQAWAQKLIGQLGVSPSLVVSFDRQSGAVATTLGQVAAQAPGTAHESFHFLLNDTVMHDNRIPPYGMSYDEARTRNALPVPATQFGNPGPGGTYQYFDQLALNPPAGATYGNVRLVYQPTSWEYVQFLWRANTGQVTRLAQEGVNLLNAWRATGMAAPHVMAAATWGTPPVSVSDCAVAEGDSGTRTCDFTVTLPAPATQLSFVDYATADGTAMVAGGDYVAASGVVSFDVGATSQTVPVTVNGDVAKEPDETFTLVLSNPANVTIGDGTGLGTIRNDEAPTVSIGDCAVTEGNAGTTPCALPVTLDVPTASSVRTSYATSDFTAQQITDYQAASGVLSFGPGVTAAVVTVSVVGDVLRESDEQFFVRLTPFPGLEPGDVEGAGTIRDDDGFTSDVAEIVHGLSVVRDLRTQPGGVADQDRYLIVQQPFTSYEVVVDATSGDFGTDGPQVERLRGADVLIQPSVPVGTGSGRALRWAHEAPTVLATEFVRVSAPSCGSGCGPDDVYRLRAYDTTYSIPRFNNTGSQVTVLLLQNRTERPIGATVHFWTAAGASAADVPVALDPHETFVLQTQPIATDQSGSITITHNGGYGALAGKTVALEPSTGFSFDSPMLPRVR